jgi:very-short-patch-repair endonuclease
MGKKRKGKAPKRNKKYLENRFLERLQYFFPDLPAPSREYRFHRKRLFRFDFAWVNLKIAIEIQGGSFIKKGGHNSAIGQARDCEKQRLATRAGWRVFPFNTHELQEKYNKKYRKKVLDDNVLFMGEYIEREIHRARKTNNR